MLHGLIVSKKNASKVSFRHDLSNSRSAGSNDRLHADVGSGSRHRFCQAVGKVRFSESQKQGPAEGLGENDESRGDRGLVMG